MDVDTAPEPDGVKKLGTTVAVSDVCSALEDGVKKLDTKVDAVLGRLALPENDKPDAEAETVAFGTAVAEKLPEAETETEADVACEALALLVRSTVLLGEESEVCFARVDVWTPVDEGMVVDGVKKLGTRVDVVLGKPALPENDRPENAESEKAEAEAEKVAVGAAETEKLPDSVIVVEAEAEALALLVLVRCPVFPGEEEEAEAEVCFARLAVWIAVDVREGMAVDGVKKLGVSVAVVSALALALALEEGVKKLETRDVADVLTLTGALADADAENEKGAFEDDAERKDPDAEGVALALNGALLVLGALAMDALRVVVRVWRVADSLTDTAADGVASIATPEDAEDAAERAADPLGVEKAEEKRALALSIADADADAVAAEGASLPLPTAVALAGLKVLENPPSVDRDAESANVDALRSALALSLLLALLVIEVEVAVLKRPDVSGLLEITDADAEKLKVDDTNDELDTEDVADDTAALSVKAESEIVGALPMFPNDADAEPTADAEAALKLLRVTECEKPALTLALSSPDPIAAETVETAELGAASVEVSDSLVPVRVDCAALALALSEPARTPELELGVARDALALVVVFAVAKSEAEAVTDPAPLVPTAFDDTAVAVLSKLTLAVEIEVAVGARDKAVDLDAKELDVFDAAEDDFSVSAPVTAEVEVEVEVEVGNTADPGVVVALALAPPRAVLVRPDLLERSITDAEEETAVVVNPPAALELDIPVSVFVCTFVFDTDAVAVVECTKPDALFIFRSKREIYSVNIETERRGEV